MIKLLGMLRQFLSIGLFLVLFCLSSKTWAQQTESDSLKNLRTAKASGGWFSGGTSTGFISVGPAASTLFTSSNGQTVYQSSFGFLRPLIAEKEPNNPPVAIVPEVAVFYSVGGTLKLKGYDPDEDEISYIVTEQPKSGTLAAVGTIGNEFTFIASPSITPGNAYPDTVRFKVVETIGEKLESEVAAFPFRFNVKDKKHNIVAFAQEEGSTNSKSFSLSFKDPQFNSSYDIALSYIDLSDPLAPVINTIASDNFELSDLVASGDTLTVNINASQSDFPYLFSANKVFINAVVSTASGFSDDDAFILDNESGNSNGGNTVNIETALFSTVAKGQFQLSDNQTSADGQFFTFASRKETQENEVTELKLFAIELGDFDLSTASISITKEAVNGTSTEPVLVKSTSSLAQWSVTYTPNGDIGYLDSLQFSVNNTERQFSAASYAKIEVVGVNDPPTLEAIANQQTDEEVSLTLDLEFTDLDNTLEVTATSSNTNVGVQLNDNKLTLTPAADFNGSANISVLVEEVGTSEAYSVFETFQVTVAPVNDRPVLEAIADQSVEEDNTFTYTLKATDVDAAVALFEYNAVPDIQGVAQISVTGNVLTVVPESDYNGTLNFTVTADDKQGTPTSISETQSFALTINEVNDAPVVSASIPTQNIVQGFPNYTIDLGQYFDDVETKDNELNYSLGTSSLFTMSVSGDVLSISPLAGQNGSEDITISASDGEASVEQTVTFNLQTQGANLMVANALNDLDVDEDFGETTVELTNVFSDNNDPNAIFEYAVLGLDNLSGTISNGVLTLFSPSNFNGDEDVFIIATANGASTFETFAITVNPVNDGPTLETVSDQTVLEDFALTNVYVGFEDIDTDANDLEFTLNSSNESLLKSQNISFERSGSGITVNATPEANVNGTSTITIAVSDGDKSASTTFELVVNSINDDPATNDGSPNDATEDKAYSFDLTSLFSDVDGDALSFSIQDGPDWLSVNQKSLGGTPLNEHVGETSFTIIADDGNGGSTRKAYGINVANTNDGPILASVIPDITVAEDALLSSLIPATIFEDADGDNLTLSATFSGADWLAFNPNTNRFTGTPTNDDIGKVEITITATDPDGEAVSDTFVLTVTNTNDIPTDISLSASTVAENEIAGTVIGNLSTTDVDLGDSFIYSLVEGTGDTDNASFDISGEKLVSKAAFDFEARNSYSVRVKTSDAGGLSYEEAVSISITNANDAPTGLSVSGTSIAENEAAGTLIGTLNATDQDSGENFTFSLTSGDGDTDNIAFEINGDQLLSTAVFDYEAQTTYSVRMKVEDSGGATYEKSVSIQVTNVAEPAIADIEGLTFESTPVGEMNTLTFTIENTGDTEIDVTSIMAPNGFSIDQSAFKVAVGASAMVMVTFAPTEAEVYDGVVVIQSTVGETRINVRGEGALITSTDDQELDENEVKLYPNPSSDLVTIDLSLSPVVDHDISIVNADGKLHFSQHNIRSKTITIDVSTYQAGIYLIRVSSAKGSIVKKLMVTK